MMIITMSFCWHIFAIVAFLLVELWTVKFFYFVFKKISPHFEEMLLDDGSHKVDVQQTKFHRLLTDEENENDKESFEYLKLKVKNENTSSGNSTANSSGNKSPV